MYKPDNPLVVQSDLTILLEVQNPAFTAARDMLNQFAELVKSPEYVYSYRLSSLSVWNAAASGMSAEQMIAGLRQYAKFALPQNVIREIHDLVSRYGRVKLIKEQEQLLLYSDDVLLITEIMHQKLAKPFLEQQLDAHYIQIKPLARGQIKQALLKIGYPVEDLAGYEAGLPLQIKLRLETLAGKPFALRSYQSQAVEAFYLHGSPRGGNGVIVLPCGAGKTIVGIGVLEKVQCETLIVATNITAVRQWINEILDKTWLTKEQVGEYSGAKKEIRPITITTYQILTYRKNKTSEFLHLELFNRANWGLVIYDEVHLLPAPVFRITAELQARRRLGLTATLVREDGQEDDVFSLIGPKRYDAPWRDLERQGWLARAKCFEIRVPMSEDLRMAYAVSNKRGKFRLAAENPEKLRVLQLLLEHHADDQVLIIGQYIKQLQQVAKHFNVPLITGTVAQHRREELYEQFRQGEEKVLVASKVANFSVDLPAANVAIQISGTFGSRQEEAQRLGRILRPGGGNKAAYFYSLVSDDSSEQTYAMNRQLFLTEQGYKYLVLAVHELGMLFREH